MMDYPDFKRSSSPFLHDPPFAIPLPLLNLNRKKKILTLIYLDSCKPALLIDMSESLLLLAILEQASGRHDEDSVDTDHTEHGSEDIVKEDVGEGSDGGRAAAHESRGGRASARRVGDEGWGGAVKVAAADKLYQEY